MSSQIGSPVPKAGEVIAGRIRAQILSTDLQVGDRLPSEGELISTHGVSRATVREALRILESEQLIEVRRGRGGGILVRYPEATSIARSLSSILTLNQSPLRDIFDFRLVVEPSASRLAAERATPSQQQRLEILSTSKVAADEVEFHFAIAQAANNVLYEATLCSLVEVTRQYIDMTPVALPHREAGSHAHIQIARAIGERDGEAAAAATERHVRAFRDLMEVAGRLDQPCISRSRWDLTS